MILNKDDSDQEFYKRLKIYKKSELKYLFLNTSLNPDTITRNYYSWQIQNNQNQQRFVLFKKLILDLGIFDHPGGRQLIFPKSNNIQSQNNQKNKNENDGRLKNQCNLIDISQRFLSINHSQNAKIMIKQYCIGCLVQQQNIIQQNKQQYLRQIFKKISDQFLNFSQQKLHHEIIKKLDLTKSIQSNVQNYSKQELFVFLKYPKFVNNNQKNLKLFTDEFKDFRRQQNIFYNIPILIIVFLVNIKFCIICCQNFQDVFIGIILFLIGLFIIWPFFQYIFHGIFFHTQKKLAEKKIISQQQIKKIVLAHGIHHAFPNYRFWLVLNFYYILIRLIIVFVLLTIVINLFFASFLTAGVLGGLILYDIMHYFFHFGWQPTFKPILYMKRSHMKHHYKDSSRGFGVTSPLWDYIFNTLHKDVKLIDSNEISEKYVNNKDTI